MTLRNAFSDLATEPTAQAAVDHLGTIAGAIDERQMIVGPRSQSGSASLTEVDDTATVDTTEFRRIVLRFPGQHYEACYAEIQETPSSEWTPAPMPDGGTEGYFSPAYTKLLAFDVEGKYALRIRLGEYAWDPVPITWTLSSEIAPQPIEIAGGVTIEGTVITQAFEPYPPYEFYGASDGASVGMHSIGDGIHRLAEVTISNTADSPVFFKIFEPRDWGVDPAIGTDTPVVWIPIPAGSTVQHAFGHVGKAFNMPAFYAVTAEADLLDATPPPAGVLVHGTYR